MVPATILDLALLRKMPAFLEGPGGPDSSKINRQTLVAREWSQNCHYLDILKNG